MQQPIIVWCGRFLTHDGYGSAARLHVGALHEYGAPVVAVDLASCTQVGPLQPELVHIENVAGMLRLRSVDPGRPISVVVNDRPDMYSRVQVAGRSRAVGYSFWETEILPAHWSDWLSSMDRVWVSSNFNRDGFVASGVPRWMIDHVGMPIDNLSVDAGDGRSALRKRWAAGTVFLSVVSSVVGRRDLGLLYEAFVTAFDAADDVTLVLKVPEKSEEKVRSVLDRVMQMHPRRASGSWPSIYVVASDLTREQLVRLHSSVDCYVSCERGDGWDLPAMDSLTLDIPVIATDFGASSDFIEETDCYVVETTTRMVTCDDAFDVGHRLYSGQYWPYVDPAQIADVLRRVHENPAERERLGKTAGARIRDQYGRERIARYVVDASAADSDVDWRSNSPAVVTVHPKDTWSVQPASWSVDRHPRLTEDRLLGLLADPDFLAPTSPAKFLGAYKRASRFASDRSDVLKGAPARRALSSSMRVGRWSPAKKVASMWSAQSEISRLVHAHGDPKLLRELVAVADDYERSLSAPTALAFEELEERRRPMWGKYGPFRSPVSDLARLEELRNHHAGERVFILGNGPSLTKCDLEKLADERTFGVNKIYLLFDQIQWKPTYYTLLDWKMGAAIADDLEILGGVVKFFPERFRGLLPSSKETYWYWPRTVGTHVSDQFSSDMVRGVPSRATVLVTAIQQAFFLGFRDIYLLGVDASYTIPDSVQQSGPDRFGTGVRLNLLSTEDDDPNHFAPNYFGRGAHWHDPNVADMRRMFRLMRKGVERRGGRLINASVGGSLEELPRVDYESLF